MLPSLFPVHLFEGGGGDYLVLRLDVTPAKVYYLDHELVWQVDEDHVIGIGFGEFILSWANLGFPGCEYHSCWVNPQTHCLDGGSPNALAWLAWLAEPSAAEMEARR